MKLLSVRNKNENRSIEKIYLKLVRNGNESEIATSYVIHQKFITIIQLYKCF